MCVHAQHVLREILFQLTKLSLNDPSIIQSGKTWDWANLKKIPHDYSLTQVPEPVFWKMCVGFYISTCLHYLEMVISIQCGTPKPFICAWYDHKTNTTSFPLFFKYFFTLPPITLFLQRTKKGILFSIIGQQQEKFKKKEGEKRKLLFCVSGGHALVKSLLMSPDYFFLTCSLMIFPLSLWGSLSSFYSLQSQEFHKNCYKVMFFL